MVDITKTEKIKIKAMYPWAKIIRPMKSSSKRKHYYLEENPTLKRYLADIRKENIISENGVPVSYPPARKPKVKKKNDKKIAPGKYKSFQSLTPNGDKKLRNNYKKDYRPKRTDFKPKGGWKVDGGSRFNNFDNNRRSNWNDRSYDKKSGGKSFKKDIWN